MGIFFGTDGIRGVVNDELTFDLAYKCGNALGGTKTIPTIIVGRDTRVTGSYITTAFSGGAMSAGAKVVDIGVCTTPGIAYITKTLNADYGTVISASHNPPEHNGIKIFTNDGYKLGDDRESALERRFVHNINLPYNKLGTYEIKKSLVNLYINFLVNSCKINLNNLTIVIDASNGASYKIAPTVFKNLGAKVIKINCKNDGININKNCGSLHPENLQKATIKHKATMGFAFDGDADRIIACDENGKILDGDIILYMLAKYFKQNDTLNNNTIVGTRHTNMGLENELKEQGISLIRTDIGDKYVIEKLLEKNLSLGGEKSGHIIISDYATTGDGILTAVKLAEMVKMLNKNLSELSNVNLYPQCNIDCVVKDKMRIINSEKLMNEIDRCEKELGENARIMVRVSGTEPKIRIMVECQDNIIATKYAKNIENVVKEINMGV